MAHGVDLDIMSDLDEVDYWIVSSFPVRVSWCCLCLLVEFVVSPPVVVVTSHPLMAADAGPPYCHYCCSSPTASPHQKLIISLL